MALFEIYCDESRQDLFTSKATQQDKFLLIGGLWLEAENRDEIKGAITKLKEAHNMRGEFKWNTVSPSRREFYLELIDLFMGFASSLRFRCIAVEAAKVDMVRYHKSNEELGFYKFYYQLIHHWILDFNEYRIFCDIKTNQEGDRIKVLQRCLNHANISSQVTSIQALPSGEVVLIQLVDFLLGVIGARLNDALTPGSVKEEVVVRLEARLDVEKLGHTYKSEQKFNVFVINLSGGW